MDRAESPLSLETHREAFEASVADRLSQVHTSCPPSTGKFSHLVSTVWECVCLEATEATDLMLRRIVFAPTVPVLSEPPPPKDQKTSGCICLPSLLESPTSWLLLSSLGNNINVVLRPWLGCAHTAGCKSHSQESRFSFHDNSPSRSLLEGQEPPQSLLKTICKVLTCLLVHFIA